MSREARRASNDTHGYPKQSRSRNPNMTSNMTFNNELYPHAHAHTETADGSMSGNEISSSNVFSNSSNNHIITNNYNGVPPGNDGAQD